MTSNKKDPVLAELKKISRLLTLVYGDVIEKKLEKIANTEKRKVMWVLIDGTRMTKDIADFVDLTERGVNKFLRELSLAEFAENPKGKPPRRLIDYVPPSWISLLEKYVKREKGEKNE